MNTYPFILTNMAFRGSQIWRNATTSICSANEDPDHLIVGLQVFRLLRKHKNFDVVLTMGSRPSLAYGLICGILRIPSKQIMTEVFLDEPRPRSLSCRLKTALFRWISCRSIGILTNSSAEVEFMARRFGIPTAKLRFVPMYTTIEHPELSTHNEGYVLSIGRTARDLDTLLLAVPHFRAPLVLVVGKHDPLPEKLPSNIRVFRDISLEECHEKIRRAAVVVIPLLPAERSTGQVVLFEAMALGKPIVATRVTGTQDYVRDGENGLLIEPGDADSLAHAVNRLLQDKSLACKLTQAAFLDCQTTLYVEQHAKLKLSAIAELQTSSPTS